MKAPDEIKKALECCFYDSAQCRKCPYYPTSCDKELVKDAREYIRQLEAERDALAADFKLYRERNIKQECGVYACDLCKHGGKYEEWEEIKCPKGCMGIKNWEWRGVQKEE